MDNQLLQPQPEPIRALCPGCGAHVANIGWLVNHDAGLVTFYHNDPNCMVTLGCQLVEVQRKVQPVSRLITQ